MNKWSPTYSLDKGSGKTLNKSSFVSKLKASEFFFLFL